MTDETTPAPAERNDREDILVQILRGRHPAVSLLVGLLVGGGGVFASSAGAPDGAKTAVLEKIEQVETEREEALEAFAKDTAKSMSGIAESVSGLREDFRRSQEARTLELVNVNSRLDALELRIEQLPEGLSDRWKGSWMELLWSRTGEAFRKARVVEGRIEVELPSVREITDRR